MTPPVPDLLFLVPARGGSKRLPGKNLRVLAGRTLLAHTQEAIAESGVSGPVLLTTDDEEIAAEGRRLGWMVPFLRPAALAADASPTEDAVLHALDWYAESRGGTDPDCVVLLQPTSPLRGGKCISDAVDLLSGRPDGDSVVSMTALHVPANYVYRISSDGAAESTSSETAGPVYYPNGAVYVTRTEALRREHSVYAGKTLVLPMERNRAVDIDTIEDWRLAEAMLGSDGLL